LRIASSLPRYANCPVEMGASSAILPAPNGCGLVIQVLLGHSKLETTALYAKVSTRTIHAVTGPLDRLMALMEGKSPPE
jgi:hypothetical protein